ncbi:hypothetical protein LG71_26690 [Pluralibacter gergoviae]|nr:hypothetical protein LG71_26690 [Pluralibacter gergoviae]
MSISRFQHRRVIAVTELSFSLLKKRITKRIYKARDLARADIFDYVEALYNWTKLESLRRLQPGGLRTGFVVRAEFFHWRGVSPIQQGVDFAVARLTDGQRAHKI